MATETVVTTDISALNRINEPSVDTGQATAGAAATLTDTNKTWLVNEWATRIVEITGGTGNGQFRNIVSNTVDTLTVAPAWTVVPDATSWYRIGLAVGAGGGGVAIDSGVSTGGGAADLQDTVKNWDIGVFEGKIIKILSGAAEGDIRKIISNTATQINVANNFSAVIVAGVNYEVLDDNAVTADVRRSTTSTMVPLAKQMDEGQVTTAGAGVLTVTDVNKNLALNCYAGYGIRIVSGTGAGSVRRIASNTAGAGTVYTCDAVLTTGVDSKYVIFKLPVSLAAGQQSANISHVAGTAQTADDWTLLFRHIALDYGTASGGAANNLVDATKNWAANSLAGKFIRIISGAAAGNVRKISANTATLINTEDNENFSAVIAAGAGYIIFSDAGDLGDTPSPYDWRHFGIAKQAAEGRVTASGASALTDGSVSWRVNVWVGYVVVATFGPAGGTRETRRIISNTADTLTVDAPWATAPVIDSRYVICHAPLTDATGRLQVDASLSLIVEGTASGGAPGVLTDATMNFDTDALENHLLIITAGTGSGLVSQILSNTATGITFNDAGVTPDATSTYKIVPWNRTNPTDPFGNMLHPATEPDAGLATAGAAGVLTDGSKVWDVDMWAGMVLVITAGTGADTASKILSNTATAITFANAAVTPDATSVYKIIPAFNNLDSGLDYGTATAGGASTLTNAGRNWGLGTLVGCFIRIISGTGDGQERLIRNNTNTVITVFEAWAVAPGATSVYVIYLGKLGVANDGSATPDLVGGVLRTIFASTMAIYSTKIVGLVISDVASAVNGLSIEQSTDDINWDYVTQFTTVGGTVLPFNVDIVGLYVRVTYTSSVAEATFRCTVSLKS